MMPHDEGGLSHVAPDGTARMVDVGAKPDTSRMARATGSIRMSVQALDATHFVVVTREARLVSKVGEDGRYMNMILPVVTHYTVQNGHLIPIEHVHVPQGYRALGAGE